MFHWPMLATMIAIPLADQSAKWGLRRALAGRRLALGRLGCLQLSDAAIWLARAPGSAAKPWLWVIWLLSAAAVTAVTMALPTRGALAGMLLGGGAQSSDGSVAARLCHRFRPADILAGVQSCRRGNRGGRSGIWRASALGHRLADS